MNLRYSIIDYIKKRYYELYKDKPNEPEYVNFNTNFESNANDYFQKIAEKYIPKPMTHIKYIFLVFKKDKDINGNEILIPFIFNIKELTKENQSILIQIERLIKHELSYRFGILNVNEYNNGKGNESEPFDDEYKLWYSRYNYGTCFHIETQYVHTMSNIADKVHNYNDSIILEELIYACSLGYEPSVSFFNKLKIYYKIREHQFYDKSNILEDYKKHKKTSKSDERKNILNIIKSNRSDFVFSLYEKEKEKVKIQSSDIQLKKENEQTGIELFKKIFIPKNKEKIIFILMYKTNQQEYTFIYNYEGKFFKLVIKSNISNIIEEIINNINEKVKYNKFNNINFIKTTKIFKLISNDILNNEYYDLLFEYNPTLIKKIKINKTPLLNVSIYYDSNLLPTEKTITLQNLYLDKSPIYREHLDDANALIKNQDCTKLRLYTNEHKEDLIKKKIIINCVHKNMNECGYNFWECLNIKEDKLLIFIVPINESEDTPYLSNFMDLDGNNNNIIKMLNALIEMYANEHFICFFHITITIKNNTLHLHVIKKIDNYSRNFSNKENEVFILQALNIYTIINNIKNYKLYYNKINYNILKTL